MSLQLRRVSTCVASGVAPAKYPLDADCCIPVGRSLQVAAQGGMRIDSTSHVNIISRRHATITVKAGVVKLSHASMNGCMINGMEVPKERDVLLEMNDVVEFGNNGEFKYRLERAPLATVTPHATLSARKCSEISDMTSVSDTRSAKRKRLESGSPALALGTTAAEAKAVLEAKARAETELAVHAQARAEAEEQVARAAEAASRKEEALLRKLAAAERAAAEAQAQAKEQAKQAAALRQSEQAARDEAESARQEAQRAAVARERVEASLECQICQEVLVRCVTLPCGHSMCGCCWRDYAQSARGKSRECPMRCEVRIEAHAVPIRNRQLDDAALELAKTLPEDERDRYHARIKAAVEEEKLVQTHRATCKENHKQDQEPKQCSPPPPPQERRQPQEPSSEFIDVCLKPGANGYGLRFTDLSDGDAALHHSGGRVAVKSMRGAAAQCGQIRIGDIVLQIDDRDVRQKRKAQVLSALRKCGATVKLRFERVIRAAGSSTSHAAAYSGNSGTAQRRASNQTTLAAALRRAAQQQRQNTLDLTNVTNANNASSNNANANTNVNNASASVTVIE